ncbi:MAG: glycosyltransferase family 4 protein [Kineosporiaceae bacterium]
MPQRSPTRVLVIVQNLPVPLDRRVWLECRALRAAGYGVSVICPRGPGDPAHHEIDGVHLYKYRPPPPARGAAGYLLEFLYCWVRTAWLSVVVRRRHGFDVIQACNPPDTYWALAALWRPLGVRFVFDQHDLNPELFRSRFGEPARARDRVQLRGLEFLERMTYRLADHVIVTNESYRRVAMTRGRLPRERTTVVRSGPDTAAMRPLPGVPELRSGARHLLAYVGIMGPQDGIDVLLRCVRHLVHDFGRTDVHVVLMGFGDVLDDMRRYAVELGLGPYVTFPGRVDAAVIADQLSSADLGLCPDLRTPLNDVSTMNKTMEYMSYALPVVAFDLVETRYSAADAAVYVPSGDEAGFAAAVAALLDDPERRRAMGLAARRRCVRDLDWRPQAEAYVGVFDRLTGRPVRDPQPTWPAAERRRGAGTPPVRGGRRAVELRGPEALADFVVSRGLPVPGEQSRAHPPADQPADLPDPARR